MSVHTVSSREFTRDVAAAKQWAEDGPVFITDRGEPAHVLLSISAYRRLVGSGPGLADALAMEGGEDIEFDPPRADLKPRLPDLDEGTDH